MDPIGSDDEVIGAGRTISEGYVDLIILLTQRCDCGVESKRDTGGPVEENAMKVTTSDAHADTDWVPELCQLDFRQPSSGVIQNSLMRHADSSSQHLVRKTKRAESANAVAGEIKASTGDRPRRCTLDDLRNEALPAQRSSDCEARDSAADNQDA
jgi:hypothetical protein